MRKEILPEGVKRVVQAATKAVSDRKPPVVTEKHLEFMQDYAKYLSPKK